MGNATGEVVVREVAIELPGGARLLHREIPARSVRLIGVMRFVDDPLHKPLAP